MNREWVKTAAIIFLAVLLVLTFFSNTIMNRTLPEVASSEVTDGSITAKVRGTGVVSAIGNTEIKANGTQSVATVKAREGAEVSAGDVLFIMGEASEELEAAQDELDSLRFALMRSQAGSGSSNNNRLQQLIDAMDQAESARDEAWLKFKEANPVDLDELEKVKAELEKVKSTYDNLLIAEADCEYDVDVKQSIYDSIPAEETEKKEQALKDLNDAKDALAQAKTAADNAKNDYDKINAKYEALMNQYPSTLYDIYQAAEAAYENAYANYAAAVDSSSIPDTSYIDAMEYQAKIAKAEKKVAELSGGEDNAITAPIAGTVSSLSVSPGDKVQKDQVMCIIEVPDLGYQMSFSATNDQAKRIKVGNKADVSNFYWGSTIEAEVASIKVDPKDPQNKKLVTVNLDGEVTTGADITVSIGEKSANYDVIVPNSAVRTDSNGSFVLAITAKNSPLGNRYFATRVPVEVLASDDSNSALNGNLSYGDFVITTSSSPIKNGDQVRLAANG